MYKVPWLDKMEKLIGPYHEFVLEILDFIKNSRRLEKLNNITDEEMKVRLLDDLNIVIGELNTLKSNKNCAYRFLEVATGTDLKKHLRDLKYEEFDILQKYTYLTDNYENIISALYTDSEIYSQGLKESFKYLYTNLISGKLFNDAINITGEVSMNEFRDYLTLENNICPYCDWYEMEFKAVSVDHFLPKSKYPLLAIYPKNLVVACAACNDRIKKDKIYLPIAHPYFDDISDFFKFRLVNKKIKIEFKNGISSIDKEKVCNFLKLFKIEERFNRYHVKKLENQIRDIRQDVYEELKNNSVTLADVEKRINSKISIQETRLSERKRKEPLTKLRLDYLNQIKTSLEIREQAEFVLWDIQCYQESDE